MPNFIDNVKDERLWAKAKEVAADSGHKEDWPYITGIFKKMKGGKVALEASDRIAQRWLQARIPEDILPGGKSDNMPYSDFDPQQLDIGQKVEMEHTDDPAIAREIAKDHLSECPSYYVRLKKMEEACGEKD